MPPEQLNHEADAVAELAAPSDPMSWELIHRDNSGSLWRLTLGGQRGWLYRFNPARGSPSITHEPA